MCGIAGYIGLDRGPDVRKEVVFLLDRQRHRGPDDRGLFCFNSSDKGTFATDLRGAETSLAVPEPGPTQVVLGCQRLAIIDRTSAGRQPIASGDARYVVVLNGEIYNYLELRASLEGKGHRFRTRTDTEVLMAAYAEWGRDCLDHLIGMFAFAILDVTQRRVFVARDHFGIKPLHFMHTGNGVAFASEISALLHWPDVSRRVDDQALYDYLDRGVVDHTDRTMFGDVTCLPPAHAVSIDLQNPTAFKPERYWRVDLTRRADMSFDQAVTRVRDTFLQSIEWHLRSDVPVGTLLSGGTDSSAIVMGMREVGGSQLDIHTFSYIGGHGAPSEEQWIDAVNTAAGTVPHKMMLEPSGFAADLPGLMEAQGEPFGSLAIYAQHKLFHTARAHGVPVVMTGQGSDEMLGGYDVFLAARLATLWRRGAWLAALRFVTRVTRGQPSRRTAVLWLLRNASLFALPLAMRPLLMPFRRPKQWIDPAWTMNAPARLSTFPVVDWDRLRDRLRFRLEVGLPDLLRYEDRSAMASSVEARVPFLTRPFVELILSLPEHYIVGPDGQTKRVFRTAMRGLVPDEVLDREDKIGFAVPLRRWPGLVPEFGETLSGAREIPGVNESALDQALASLSAGNDLEAKDVFMVWRLWGLAAWAQHFGVQFD